MPNTLLDKGLIIKIINQKKAINLEVVIYKDRLVLVILANRRYITLIKYIFITINLSKV